MWLVLAEIERLHLNNLLVCRLYPGDLSKTDPTSCSDGCLERMEPKTLKNVQQLGLLCIHTVPIVNVLKIVSQ